MDVTYYHFNAVIQELKAELAELRSSRDEQAEEIFRLKAMVKAMSGLFVDLELIDKEALAYHLKSALGEAERMKGVPAPPDAEQECNQCHKVVPSSEISYTDVGALCDRCYLQRQAGGHEESEI